MQGHSQAVAINPDLFSSKQVPLNWNEQTHSTRAALPATNQSKKLSVSSPLSRQRTIDWKGRDDEPRMVLYKHSNRPDHDCKFGDSSNQSSSDGIILYDNLPASALDNVVTCAGDMTLVFCFSLASVQSNRPGSPSRVSASFSTLLHMLFFSCSSSCMSLHEQERSRRSQLEQLETASSLCQWDALFSTRESSRDFVVSAEQFRSLPKVLGSSDILFESFDNAFERSGDTRAVAVTTCSRCTRIGGESARFRGAGCPRSTGGGWRRAGE